MGFSQTFLTLTFPPGLGTRVAGTVAGTFERCFGCLEDHWGATAGGVEWLNSETQGPGQGDTFASFALWQFLGYLLKVMFSNMCFHRVFVVLEPNHHDAKRKHASERRPWPSVTLIPTTRKSSTGNYGPSTYGDTQILAFCNFVLLWSRKYG